MALIKKESSVDVVTAARQRIKNVFSNGLPVYLNTSGGKDSICLESMTYDLILKGEIDPKQLTVIFIDEETVYDSMIENVKEWRQKFLGVGAKFEWYCLPFKQVCCMNQLEDSETWVTFDPKCKDVWVRQPPKWAITHSDLLNFPGEMTYQSFCDLRQRDGITILGIRASESVQRLSYVARAAAGKKKKATSGQMKVWPIYDWTDRDVWKYIREHNLDFPEAYLWIYQLTGNRNKMRLSNFFGFESVAGLRFIAENDPVMWERIEKREPNAYLVLLYWDSAMFHRSTAERRAMEKDLEQKDYKEILRKIFFQDFDKEFDTEAKKKVANYYKRLYIWYQDCITQKECRKIYESLKFGDPKMRSLRAMYTTLRLLRCEMGERDEQARKAN